MFNRHKKSSVHRVEWHSVWAKKHEVITDGYHAEIDGIGAG